jgi:hypothetical protein
MAETILVLSISQNRLITHALHLSLKREYLSDLLGKGSMLKFQ